MYVNKKVKVSWRGTIVRKSIAALVRVSGGDAIAAGRKYAPAARASWKPPKKFFLQRIFLATGACAEYLVPPGAEQRGTCILQLHGGGFIIPYTRQHQKQSVRLATIAGPLPVMSLDYRVAPEHRFPAALEDAVAAIEWLNREKGMPPESIIVFGESAGGGLALSLAMWLRDHKIGRLKAITLISPWTDLTGKSRSHKERLALDPFFGQKKDRRQEQRQSSIPAGSIYAGENELVDPYISPAFGDMTDMPPLLIHAGEHEILFDDAAIIHEKAVAAGIDSHFHEWTGMFHCFQMAHPFVPEARTAWQEIGGFIRKLIN